MIKALEYLQIKLAEHEVRGYDLKLLGVTVLLVFAGVLMVYSASTPLSDRTYGSSLVMLRNHLIHLMVGGMALWVAMRIPYQRYERWMPWLLLAIFLALVLVLIPGLGYQVGGARRWLRLGPFNAQPTEALKLILVIYVASYLTRKGERLTHFFRGVFPNLVVMGMFLAMVLLQPDFGTVVLIALTLLLMIFLGGGQPRHLLYSLMGFGLIGLYLIGSQSYRMRRIFAFLDPWGDRLDSGFQIVQSYLAFGSGGWFGVGLGDSSQKHFFLPDAHTDFIFAIVGEELGLLGVWVLIALFCIFAWRGFRIALAAKEEFARHLACGIATMFSLQILLNMAVVMGLMPTKGLPLPFISYGGSSLVGAMFMVGILLNISAGGAPRREAESAGRAGTRERT